MVYQIACDCDERTGIEINSDTLFEELKQFFENRVQEDLFTNVSVECPYYIGYSDGVELKWFASKWYKCKSCCCLWEFQHPEFPAKGFVRKFKDGKYTVRIGE